MIVATSLVTHVKIQSGSNMLALYLDKDFVNEYGQVEPKFVVLFAIEVPRSEFTYANATNKIVELNDLFDFDWIAIDRGYGELQIELLKQYGILNPESGLVDKIIPYHFGEKLNVRDPHTLRVDKKDMKPFMVNNSVLAFERNKVVLDPNDKNLIEQLYAYRVEKISQKGMPIYTSENEHSLDCLNMCLLTFERKYGTLFKNILTNRILGIKSMLSDGNIIDRNASPNEQNIGYARNNNITIMTKKKKSVFKKRSFVGRAKF